MEALIRHEGHESHIEALIREVRQRPVLYDLNSSRTQRQKVWTEISEKLGNYDVHRCKRLWYDLRGHLSVLNKARLYNHPTPAKRWKWEKAMAWLLPFIKHRKCKRDLEVHDEEIMEISDSKEEPTDPATGHFSVGSDNEQPMSDINPPLHDNDQCSSVSFDSATYCNLSVDNDTHQPISDNNPPLLANNLPTSLLNGGLVVQLGPVSHKSQSTSVESDNNPPQNVNNDRPTSLNTFHSLRATSNSTNSSFADGENNLPLHDNNAPVHENNQTTSLAFPHSRPKTFLSLDSATQNDSKFTSGGENNQLDNNNSAMHDENSPIDYDIKLLKECGSTSSTRVQDSAEVKPEEKKGKDTTTNENALKSFFDSLFSTVHGFSKQLQIEIKGKFSALLNDFEVRNLQEAKGTSTVAHEVSYPVIPSQTIFQPVPSQMNLQSMASQVNLMPSQLNLETIPSQPNPQLIPIQKPFNPTPRKRNLLPKPSQMYLQPLPNQMNPQHIPNQMNFQHQVNFQSIPSQMVLPFIPSQMNVPAASTVPNVSSASTNNNPTTKNENQAQQTDVASQNQNMTAGIQPYMLPGPVLVYVQNQQN